MGAVYAFSEMEHHMFMLREWYAHFVDLSPGMAGFENCTPQEEENRHGAVLGSTFFGH